MNVLQRIIIFAGVSVVLILGLYSPWTATISYLGSEHNTTVHRSAGYHWIFKAPSPADNTTFEATFGDTDTFRAPRFRDTLRYEIDTSRLLLEWLMVVLVTVGLLVATKTKRRDIAS
jgi:hypothetical protein